MARGKKTDRPYAGPKGAPARFDDDGDPRMSKEERKELQYDPELKTKAGAAMRVREEEDRLHELIEDVDEFMNFRQKILPALRQDLEAGLPADEIYAKYASVAAARGVMNAVLGEDAGKSQQAIRDMLDRVQGKAVERKRVEHAFENVEDEHLDALLISALKGEEDDLD